MKELQNGKSSTHFRLLWCSGEPTVIKDLLIVFIARLATTEVDQNVMKAIVVNYEEVLMNRFRELAHGIRGVPKLVAHVKGA